MLGNSKSRRNRQACAGQRQRVVFEALEPRVLMAADGLGVATSLLRANEPEPAAVMQTTTPAAASSAQAMAGQADQGTAAQQAATDARTVELVVIDTGLAATDRASLLADLQQQTASGRAVQILQLDAQRDPIAQISLALSAADEPIAAIHLFSHSDAQGLQLGHARLDASTWDQYAPAIAGWSAHLTEQADILLYGCDLAASAQGLALMAQLADATGADVAASDDQTGAASDGADWVLEQRTGAVQAEVALTADTQQHWQQPLAAFAAAAGVSSETLVNNQGVAGVQTTASASRGSQRAVDVADNGTSVVVWTSTDGGSSTIWAQRFDEFGVAVAGEAPIKVVEATAGTVRHASVAVVPGGRGDEFVVAWESDDGAGQGGVDIYAQMHGAGLTVSQSAFQVNTTAVGTQSNPIIDMGNDGRFVIVWESANADQPGLFAQQYDKNGNAKGAGEIQIADGSNADVMNPALTVAANGDFWVAYDQQTPNAMFSSRTDTALVLQGFKDDGNTRYSPQTVAQRDMLGGEFKPALGYREHDKSIVLVWHQPDNSQIRYAIYGDDDSQVVAPTTVYGELWETVRSASVAAASTGEFLIAFERNAQGSATPDVYVQRYDISGQQLGVAMVANTTTNGTQANASVVMRNARDFSIVWSGAGAGDNDGVFIRTFTPGAYAVLEDTSLSVLANDGVAVIHQTNNNTVTVGVLTGPTQGTLDLNPDGSFAYTPNANFFGTDSFTYTITSNGPLNGSTQTATIEVVPVNDAPRITTRNGAQPNTYTTGLVENELTNFDLQFAATDPDSAAASLTWSLVTGPNGEGADNALFVIDAGTGQLSFKQAPDFETKRDADQDNRYDVYVQVFDGFQTDAVQGSIVVNDISNIARVTTTDDNNDAGIDPNNPAHTIEWLNQITANQPNGTISLREALMAANNAAPTVRGRDNQIAFNLSGSGIRTLSPLSALPIIDRPVFIDGYSQPGASPNADAVGTQAQLRIELDGSSVGAGPTGLHLNANADGSVIQGLAINRFRGAGIRVDGATDVEIRGNFIGTEPGGMSALPMPVGVLVTGGAVGTRIGKLTLDDPLYSAEPRSIDQYNAVNLISGNQIGVLIEGAGTHGTRVLGNLFGTTGDGVTRVSGPTGGVGISLRGDVDDVQIGALGASFGNVFGGLMRGVLLDTSDSVDPQGIRWAGNRFIGNDGQAVSLGDALTANNQLDTAQANGGLDTPVLQQAGITAASTLTVFGRVGTIGAGSNFAGLQVDLYQSDPLQPSQGAGRVWLGSASVNADGSFGIDALLIDPALVTVGSRVTASVTHPSFGSSEFSLPYVVTDGLNAPPVLNQVGGQPVTLDSTGYVPMFLRVAENLRAVTTVQGSDVNASPVSYRLAGGADAALFDIDAQTGALSFKVAPDFENPAHPDHLYRVNVEAFDGFEASQPLQLTVEVTDIDSNLVVTNNSDIDNIDWTAWPASNTGEWVNQHAGADGLSLREAINAANRGNDRTTIHFDLPAQATTIRVLGTALPALTAPVQIDGYSQAGASVNTQADITFGSNATLLVTIDGSALTASNQTGLELAPNSGGSTIRGLNIANFTGDGLHIRSSNNTIAGNFIGVDRTGMVRQGTLLGGIEISAGSANNVIGGAAPADRNLVSGTGFQSVADPRTAIQVLGANANGNVIRNNLVGADSSGRMLAGGGTGNAGIAMRDGPIGTVVEGNLIVGAGGDGIAVTGTGSATRANAFRGNYFTDRFGNANGGQAIDLGNDGLASTSTNGALDALPNEGMDRPTLTRAQLSNGRLVVEGYVGTGAVNDSPFKTATIELYLTDGSALADQEVILRPQTVTATVAPNGTFSAELTGIAQTGNQYRIAATATLNSNTSEMSDVIAVQEPPAIASWPVSVPVGQEDLRLSLAGFEVADSNGGLLDVSLQAVLGSPSDPQGSMRVVIPTGNGVVIVNGANNSSAMTLRGSAADLNTVLATLSYLGADNANGTGSVTVAVTDAGLLSSGPLTLAFNLQPTDDDPSFQADTPLALTATEYVANVGTLLAVDPDGTAITYTVINASDNVQSVDGDWFEITSDGLLRFKQAPDVDAPKDGAWGTHLAGDNVYRLIVQARDDNGGFVTHALDVTVVANVMRVTTNADTNDSGISSTNPAHNVAWLQSNRGSDGQISLREAIIAANNTVGLDRIEFEIVGGGTQTITVTGSALPAITSPIHLDATTQDGWVGNTAVTGSNAELRVQLFGNRMNDQSGTVRNGLTLADGSDGSTIRGLVIQGFDGDAIEIWSDDNLIAGNFLGVGFTGLASAGLGSAGNVGNRASGVQITNDGSRNQIGSAALADRNLIALNGRQDTYQNGSSSFSGIRILGAGSAQNVVAGNLIGTDKSGLNTTGFGNGNAGVHISDAHDNIIGGTAANASNVLAGNRDEGVWIVGSTATGNQILRNSFWGQGLTAILLAPESWSTTGVDNDSAVTASRANWLMDWPTIGSATVRNGQLTVSGFVGNGAASSVFAGATIQLYIADPGSSDPRGDGRHFVGTVTADSTGAFTGTLDASQAPWAANARLTATATLYEPGRYYGTSEFGPRASVAMPATVTVPTGRTFDEDLAQPAALTGIVVDDADATINRVQLVVTRGSLSLLGTVPTGLTSSGTGTATLTLEGSLAAINQALTSNLGYRPAANFNGSVTLTVTASSTTDPTATTSATGTLSVTNINDAPVIGNNNSDAAVTLGVYEGQTIFRTMTYTDADSTATGYQPAQWRLADGVDSARFSIGATTGVLRFNNPPNFEERNGLAYQLTVIVDDGQGGVDTQALTINLLDVPDSILVDTTSDTNDSGILDLNTGSTQPGEAYDYVWLLDNRGADGKISLREAIIAANNTLGPQDITFRLPTGSTTITLTQALPVIRDAVVINAYQGTGATQNSRVDLTQGSNAQLRVMLDGGGRAMDGLVLGAGSSGSQIAGLALGNLSGRGIVVLDSSNNTIWGNFIGTGLSGLTASPITQRGISIEGTSTNNLIGGTQALARNLVSNAGTSGGAGIGIVASGNRVLGNLIGSTAAGVPTMPNGRVGVAVRDGAVNVIVGGVDAGAANLIVTGTDAAVSVENVNAATVTDQIEIRGNRLVQTQTTVLPIDLFRNTTTGLNDNDGLTDTQRENHGVDRPVITQAQWVNGELRIAGYVGTGVLAADAPASVFAGGTVDLYLVTTEAANRRVAQYIATAVPMLVDARGRFEGVVAAAQVSGLAVGTNLTATLTHRLSSAAADSAGATSEMALLQVVTTPPWIQGFDLQATEDISTRLINADAQTFSVGDLGGDLNQVVLSVARGTLGITTGPLPSGWSLSADRRTMTLTGSQTQINNALKDLTYTSDLNVHGDDTLVVRATDAAGQTSGDVSFRITVAAADDAPVIASAAVHSVMETVQRVSPLLASDADGDTVGFRISGGVDRGLFAIDANQQLVFAQVPDFEALSLAKNSLDPEVLELTVQVEAFDQRPGTPNYPSQVTPQTITVRLRNVSNVLQVNSTDGSRVRDVPIEAGNAAHTIEWLNARYGSSVTLHEAIIAANNTPNQRVNDQPVNDRISFVFAGTGERTITLTQPLPAITGGLTLVGRRSDASLPDALGNPAWRTIINASGQGSGDALVLGAGSDGSLVSGLAIEGSPGDGLKVLSDNNQITDNLIGGGSGASQSNANRGAGVVFAQGASNNTFGSATQGQGNIVAGNVGDGVVLTGADTTGNVLLNNLIGAAQPVTESQNGGAGVRVAQSTHGNSIGGVFAQTGNVIAGNGQGVVIESSGESAPDKILIENNIIRTLSTVPAIDLQNDDALHTDGLTNPLAVNAGLDRPGITAASLRDRVLTLSGQIPAAFNNARVVLYLSQGAVGASGQIGERLGEFTVPDAGWAQGTITVPDDIAISADSVITAVMIRDARTSESIANIAVNVRPTADYVLPSNMPPIREDAPYRLPAVTLRDDDGDLLRAAISVTQGTLTLDGSWTLPDRVTRTQTADGWQYTQTDAQGRTVGEASLVWRNGTMTATLRPELAGSMALAEALLSRLVYQSAADTNGPVTISGVMTDVAGLSNNFSESFTVMPVNDAPTWATPGLTPGLDRAEVSLAENTRLDLNLVGADVDLDPTKSRIGSDGLTYRLVNATTVARTPSAPVRDASALFTVTSANNRGLLNFATAVDFEALRDSGMGSVFDLVLEVRDNEGLTATRTLRVTVTNAWDNAVSAPINMLPDLSGQDLVFTVDEGPADPDLVVLLADALDNDDLVLGVSYSLLDGSDPRFQIDADTGAVTAIAGAEFDAEGALTQDPAPVLIVQAQSLSDPNDRASTTFKLQVNNVDEGGPTPIRMLDGSTRQIERTAGPGGSNLFQVASTEPDSPFDQIRYSLADGTDLQRFTIDTMTGQVSLLAGTSLDFESGEAPVITVLATSWQQDGDGVWAPSEQVAEASYTLDIRNDSNEAQITEPAASAADTAAIVEGADNGSFTGLVVRASDADRRTTADAQNDTVSYRLSDADLQAGKFRIDAQTGEVFVANGNRLNARANPVEAITVIATSSDGSFKQSQLLRIQVLSSVIADQNTAANRWTENASDRTVGIDLGQQDTRLTGVWYELAPADANFPAADRSLFVVDRDTGLVSMAASDLIDMETNAAARTVVVLAHLPNRAEPQRLTLTVQMLDDRTESRVDALTDADTRVDNLVDEGSRTGTYTGLTAQSVDRDVSDREVRYALVDDADGRFSINAVTGEVFVADGSKLDFESAVSHTIRIRASSPDGSTFEQAVSINIGNVNDAPTATAQAVAAAEYADAGTVVARVTGLDADAGAQLRYSLIDPANRFAMDPVSGVVTVVDPGALHRNSPITLRYQVSDRGVTATGELTLIVTAAPLVAAADQANTQEDTAVTVLAATLLGNDSKAGMRLVSVTQPAHGSLERDLLGNLTYRPAANYHGDDSFSYTAQDPWGRQATAVVALRVAAFNDVPVPVAPAEMAATAGQQLQMAAQQFPITDVEGDALQMIRITSLPSLGSLQLRNVPVALNQLVSVADLNAGALSFVSPAVLMANATTEFSYRVADQTGDAAPLSEVSARMQIVIRPDMQASIGSIGTGGGGGFMAQPAETSSVLGSSGSGVLNTSSTSTSSSSTSTSSSSASANSGSSTSSATSSTAVASATQGASIAAASGTGSAAQSGSSAANKVAGGAKSDGTESIMASAVASPAAMAAPVETPHFQIASLASELAIGKLMAASGGAQAQAQAAAQPRGPLEGVNLNAHLNLLAPKLTQALTQAQLWTPSSLSMQASQQDSGSRSSNNVSYRTQATYQQFDQLRQQVSDKAATTRINSVVSSVAVSGSMSVGYVIWLLRGGVLASTMLSSMPAWRSIDPLPVLSRAAGDDGDDEGDSLESLVSGERARGVMSGAPGDRLPMPTVPAPWMTRAASWVGLRPA